MNFSRADVNSGEHSRARRPGFAVALTALSLAAMVLRALAAEPASPPATAARKLYVAKCAKCHKFHDPKNYNDATWQRWIDAMSRKAKLKPQQDELLRWYLSEYRAGRIPQAK